MNALGLDRNGYYFFLRRVYGMGAMEAWVYIKRVGIPPTLAQLQDAIK